VVDALVYTDIDNSNDFRWNL